MCNAKHKIVWIFMMETVDTIWIFFCHKIIFPWIYSKWLYRNNDFKTLKELSLGKYNSKGEEILVYCKSLVCI